MNVFDENMDDFLSDSPIDFETELFPEFEENGWSVGKTTCDDDELNNRDLRRSVESRSEGAYDSDESASIIDVGEPEHVLETRSRKSTEGDDELVSYLTGIRVDQGDSQDKRNSVKIVRILSQNQPNKIHSVEPRILKIDASGNQRMLRAVKVVNPPARLLENENHLDRSVSNSSIVYPDYRCKSKSAIAARENRERKKKYISELEGSVKELSEQNKQLKEQNISFSDTVDSLKHEVAYLKSVIANQSTLAKLLQNIPGIPDISFSAPEAHGVGSGSRKRTRESPSTMDENDNDQQCRVHKKVKRGSDHGYSEKLSHSVSGLKNPQSKEEITGGVCLHVSGSAVSLEFCSRCNQKARSTAL